METPKRPTVSLTIAQELLDKVDMEAAKLYISRSAWIVTAVAQKLQSEEILRALPAFTDTIRLALQNDQAKNKKPKSEKRDTDITEKQENLTVEQMLARLPTPQADG